MEPTHEIRIQGIDSNAENESKGVCFNNKVKCVLISCLVVVTVALIGAVCGLVIAAVKLSNLQRNEMHTLENKATMINQVWICKINSIS